ncbi:hypothetical protein D0Y65_042397 [Glycine soja]|uniref:Uncharacterized protein n=1 Tax=Glycine soja TaxID=3848 RepID=A0A445GD39_GLYSO|nr:hypothetical protein D0Y65_042397 [Glycine soja]
MDSFAFFFQPCISITLTIYIFSLNALTCSSKTKTYCYEGSEKLFQLVSDSSKTSSQSHELCWVLRPSKELENLVPLEDDQDGLSQHAIVDICKIYDLNTKDVIKYEKYIF